MSTRTRRAHVRGLMRARFEEQGGACYYCERAAWHPGIEDETAAGARLGICGPELLLREASAEHLTRRTDGGRDHHSNIVMACRECNQDRGERTVLEHVKAQRQKYQRWPDGVLFAEQPDISAQGRKSAVVLQFGARP